MLDIRRTAEYICSTSPELRGLQTTVQKELLHYEVLAAMSKHGYLNKLTFQGGTCLRMMYQSNRMSEDLDFAGGEDFDFDQLSELKALLLTELRASHDLEIHIHEPDLAKLNQNNPVAVGRWKISIQTEPQKTHLPWQRVRLEIANVKAHTRNLRPLNKTYPEVPDAYTNTLVYCESLEEICADKVVALALRRRIKARDLWDLTWLNQNRIRANARLVEQKFKDYQRSDGLDALKSRLLEVPTYLQSGAFENEMSRFVHSATAATTLEREGFTNYVQDTVVSMISQVVQELSGGLPFRL